MKIKTLGLVLLTLFAATIMLEANVHHRKNRHRDEWSRYCGAGFDTLTVKSATIKHGLYKAVQLRNNTDTEVLVKELYVEYGVGKPSIWHNIKIGSMLTHYQDFRGAARKVKELRVVWGNLTACKNGYLQVELK